VSRQNDDTKNQTAEYAQWWKNKTKQQSMIYW
jgi:hypothetical protein